MRRLNAVSFNVYIFTAPRVSYIAIEKKHERVQQQQQYDLRSIVLCPKLVLYGSFSRYQFRGRTVSLRHFGQCFFESVCRKHQIIAHRYTHSNLIHTNISTHITHILFGACYASRFLFFFLHFCGFVMFVKILHI